jgi:hypothetical protein
MEENQQGGSLSWRLSSHPITLLFFLGFRICKCALRGQRQQLTFRQLLFWCTCLVCCLSITCEYCPCNYRRERGVRELGLTGSYSVLIFIITILLLAADFYYLKNIAGRRLVGLRWWNEVDPQTGDSHWVFESSDPSTKVINATDSRFFWIALYSQPLLWIGLAIVAIFSFELIWLTLVGMFGSSGCGREGADNF